MLTLLATACVLFAQNGASPDYSGLPDVRRIVESSIAVAQRGWRERLQYSYRERDESRRLDQDGRVKSQDVDVSITIPVNGIPYEKLVERNGRPPSAEEERKQNETLDKLKRVAPDERAERLRRQEEEWASIVHEVPRAFDFHMEGEEEINGRKVWVLQATPHPGYQAQGKYGKLFSRVAGKLWVDKQDFAWVKVDGQVIQPFSIGLVLARVLSGSHITMEQSRVRDGIWMPERFEVRAAARIFFVKNLVIDRILTYSEYQAPTDPVIP